MNINKIFSTKERIKIIDHIIYKEGKISVNNIANELRLSKGLVSKYLDILVKEKILKKTKNKLLVLNNLYVKGLKILLNLSKFDANLFRKYGFVSGVGIYGSCAKGTNTESSDIDIWIKITKVKEVELVDLGNKLKKIGNIKPLFLTKEKIDLLKQEDKLFYHSIVFGSIILYGEEIEI